MWAAQESDQIDGTEGPEGRGLLDTWGAGGSLELTRFLVKRSANGQGPAHL